MSGRIKLDLGRKLINGFRVGCIVSLVVLPNACGVEGQMGMADHVEPTSVPLPKSDRKIDELLDAAFSGDNEKVKSILASGVNVNATNPRGETALMWAAKGGQASTFELLMLSGANHKSVDAKGWNYLAHAAVAGKNALIPQYVEIVARTCCPGTPRPSAARTRPDRPSATKEHKSPVQLKIEKWGLSYDVEGFRQALFIEPDSVKLSAKRSPLVDLFAAMVWRRG